MTPARAETARSRQPSGARTVLDRRALNRALWPGSSSSPGGRPVQLKIGVTDKARARRFYEGAFDLAEQVIRHTDDDDVTGYQFGDYGQPGFFLLVLLDDTDFDHPGHSTLGFSVPDPDTTHARAVQAGGTETVAATTAEGIPRTSVVTDPDGNWIWLYQR